MLDRDEAGNVVRKAGIMGVVVTGGDVRPGDAVVAELPAGTTPAAAPGVSPPQGR